METKVEIQNENPTLLKEKTKGEDTMTNTQESGILSPKAGYFSFQAGSPKKAIRMRGYLIL